MTYSIYSFVALSPLRKGTASEKPGPLEQKHPSAVQPQDELRLRGSAKISGISRLRPWYARMFPRLRGPASPPPVKEQFEFELIFKANPEDPPGGNAGLANLRKQLGLTPDVKSAIIEIFVKQGGEDALTVDLVEPAEN